MGKSVYFYNCIREIRQTVYGRDMRKPIVDAIWHIADTSGIDITQYVSDLTTDFMNYYTPKREEDVALKEKFNDRVIFVELSSAEESAPDSNGYVIDSGGDSGIQILNDDAGSILIDNREFDYVILDSGKSDYKMYCNDPNWQLNSDYQLNYILASEV